MKQRWLEWDKSQACLKKWSWQMTSSSSIFKPCHFSPHTKALASKVFPYLFLLIIRKYQVVLKLKYFYSVPVAWKYTYLCNYHCLIRISYQISIFLGLLLRNLALWFGQVLLPADLWAITRRPSNLNKHNETCCLLIALFAAGCIPQASSVWTLVHSVVKYSRPPDLKSSSNVSLSH